MDNRKACARCGEMYPLTALGCTKCGQPFPALARADVILPCQKSPGRALFLSFALLAGCGQIYVGQFGKAAIWMAITFLAGLPTFGVGTLVANIASGIDAQKVARKLSRGEPVGVWEWFPK